MLHLDKPLIDKRMTRAPDFDVHTNVRHKDPYWEHNREVADSSTWGIFIRDTAYISLIQWSMTLCFIESQWNMPYLVWKCLTYGSQQPPYYIASHPPGGTNWGRTWTAKKWKNGRKYRRMRKKLGNVPFFPPEVESLAAPMAPTQVSPIALGVQVYLFNRINDFSFSPKNKTEQKQTKQNKTKQKNMAFLSTTKL